MMNCGRNSCVYPALIAGILAGVVLGLLYAFGYVAANVLFLAYFGIGVLGLFALPVYGLGGGRCYCKYRRALLTGAIGTVVTAAIGAILAAVADTVVVAIAVGVATLFVVLLLGILVCLANCLCEE